MKEKLAIVGTGMSAMSAAYFLKDDYEITLFEKNDYIGGHTNTITVNNNGETATFDTGFMVFNEVTYPNMLKLFKHLEVPYEDTDSIDYEDPVWSTDEYEWNKEKETA